jgi:hypothetical protein
MQERTRGRQKTIARLKPTDSGERDDLTPGHVKNGVLVIGKIAEQNDSGRSDAVIGGDPLVPSGGHAPVFEEAFLFGVGSARQH